jgi:hypothetical protein
MSSFAKHSFLFDLFFRRFLWLNFLAAGIVSDVEFRIYRLMISLKHFGVILGKCLKLLFFPHARLLLRKPPLAIGKLLEESGSMKHPGDDFVEILAAREPRIIPAEKMLCYRLDFADELSPVQCVALSLPKKLNQVGLQVLHKFELDVGPHVGAVQALPEGHLARRQQGRLHQC